MSDPINLHDFHSYYRSFLVPFSEIVFLDVEGRRMIEREVLSMDGINGKNP